MFSNITNMNHTRTVMEAVTFYLFYTVLLVGLSTFLGHYLVTLGIIGGTVGGFFDGGNIHTMIGTGWVLVLSSLILTAKKMTSDIMAVVLTMVGLYLAFTINVMLGMVVVAYLTTLGK